MRRTVLRSALPSALAALLLATPSVVLAHGQAPAPLGLSTALTAWAFDPLVWSALLAAMLGYLALVRSVDRAHPGNRVPRRRVVAWLGALAVTAVALQSAIDIYATSLFSVHMVQHLLLTMVAAPLFALGAPITLLLRAASPAGRRKVILPVLHSRVLRLVSFPVVTWVVFAAVMWVSHFSPLFDTALDDPLVHTGEHLLYLGAGMLFWWPVVGADPSPWRLGHAARLGYVFLGMPQNTFLALAIFSAPAALYPHYATLQRSWGPTPLADQQVAGGIMWLGGDLLFFVAVVLAVRAWMRAEDERGARMDARLDRERARGEAASNRRTTPSPGEASGH
ncbi:cytochrome c oxidase assembly protein [soil metagenome]